MDSQDSGHEKASQVLKAARSGDRGAVKALCTAYLPSLRRFCRGRMPAWTAELIDVDQLICESLRQTLRQQGNTEPANDTFHTDLRSLLLNNLNKEVLRTDSEIPASSLSSERETNVRPLLEEFIGKRQLACYETALSQLSVEDQQLLVMRLEFGFSYQDIAESFSRLSEEAVRKGITTALLRLAEKMNEVSNEREDQGEGRR